MRKSYLLTALRHFSRNKLHASINILGLGLGIMVSLLALIFLLSVSFKEGAAVST